MAKKKGRIGIAKIIDPKIDETPLPEKPNQEIEPKFIKKSNGSSTSVKSQNESSSPKKQQPVISKASTNSIQNDSPKRPANSSSKSDACTPGRLPPFQKFMNCAPVIFFPFNPVSMQSMMMNPMTMQPMMNPMAMQPMMNPMAMQPMMNPMAMQPMMNPMTMQPMMNPMTMQPMMNPMVMQPMMNPMARQPMMNPMVMQPTMMNPMAMQPMMNPMKIQ